MAPRIAPQPPRISHPKPAPPPPAATPPPPTGGESKPGKLKTWVDTQNPLVPKDGYLEIDYKKMTDPNTGASPLVPTRIELANGKYATVKTATLSDQGRTRAYVVSAPGQPDVLAVPLGPGSGGAFRFYVATPGANDKMTLDGRSWSLTDWMSPPTGHLFQLASSFVNRGDPPVTSPADLAAQKKARDRGAAAGVAKQVDALQKQTVAAKAQLAQASATMAKELQFLMPAINDGTVRVDRDGQGRIRFEIAQNPSMKPGERLKLEEHFGDRLANLTASARVVEKHQQRAAAMREQSAAELVQQVNSGPFIAHLESLKPAERMAKMKEIAAQVVGTRAGAQLASDLFEYDYNRRDASMGNLTPKTELGKMLFKDVYKDPAAWNELKGVALHLAPHMPGDRYGATERLFEINLGRKLEPNEVSAAFKITNASPQELEQPGLLDKSGDVSSMLAALGDGAEKVAERGGKLARGAQISETSLKAGAAVVGTFQLTRGIYELAKDPTLGNAVNVTEDATRAVGAWASWLGKTKAHEHLGKVLGTTSDVIGLMKDLHGLATAKSPEKKYDKFVSSYASALIVAGGLAASVTPWGIAAQVVGLGVKLFREETSDAYDKAYGTLKNATKTDAERAAEAAAKKADYERRSNNWNGRMQ